MARCEPLCTFFSSRKVDKMSEKVKIAQLALENVKVVKSFFIEPSPTGLTIIGGKNCQGKTTVLDSIIWLLLGNRYKPSSPKRDEALRDPNLDMTLTNGIRIQRKGKNSDLKVTDTNGKRAGQALLDALIEPYALDVPKFVNGNDREKAEILLNTLGIGDQVRKMEEDIDKLYKERQSLGQIASRKRKHAEEMQEDADPELPATPLSAAEQIQKYQEVIARNAENQKKREYLHEMEESFDRGTKKLESLLAEVEAVKKQLDELSADIHKARLTTEQLQDESTEELQEKIRNVESINARVRMNLEKQKALDEASELEAEYADMSEKLNAMRDAKFALLEGQDWPLEGLNVDEGKVLFNVKAWDCMSGAEQLIVSASIAKELKPECGIVLIDKLEQFDSDTLMKFGEWATENDLQIIGTRVSTNADECTIIIEDGIPLGQSYAEHRIEQEQKQIKKVEPKKEETDKPKLPF